MLTIADKPTIRNAIMRRLDGERGVQVCDILVEARETWIAVGIESTLDSDNLKLQSGFHLPLQFEIGHLHNEIDQIAEQYKAARRDYWLNGRQIAGPKMLAGTGLRGLWAAHGAL